MWFGQRTIKTCSLFPGLPSCDPKELDNVSCYKMEVNNISLDNEIPDVFGRKNCSYHISINLHSSESLWKPKGPVHRPTGRALYRSSYESSSHSGGHRLLYCVFQPRSLGKLFMYIEFFTIIILRETGC